MVISGFHYSLKTLILSTIIMFSLSTCDVLTVGYINRERVYNIECEEGSIRITTNIWSSYIVCLECRGTYTIKPQHIKCQDASYNDLSVLVKCNDKVVKEDTIVTDNTILILIEPLSRKRPQSIYLDLSNFLRMNGKTVITNSFLLSYH